jgi:hypothetical protein
MRQCPYGREHASQKFLTKASAVKRGVKQLPCSLFFIGVSGDHAPRS